MKKTSILLAAGILIFTACKSPADKKNSTADSTTIASAAKPEAPAQADSSVVTTKEYQVTKPEGWQKTVRVLEKYELVIISAPKENDYQSNINVLKDDMKGKAMDDYIAFNMKQMTALNVTEPKVTDITVGDIKGKQLDYKAKYAGRNLVMRSYILPKDGTAYVLTGSTITSSEDKYMPEFDKVAQSFKLL